MPAGSAVVLKGNLFATIAKTANSDMTSNDLLPSTGITADGTQYVLAENDGKVAFYNVTVGTDIPAGKAYISSNAGIKAFYFEGNEATGINTISTTIPNSEDIYNLAGQRLNKMQKGINIVNGKKILK